MAFAVDLTGTILDRRYRITGLLGKGGMGHVYEAMHMALDQCVAVKVLHPCYAHEERFRERFLQEARAASKIRHPNVVEIKDFGDTPDGSVYFVMEYLHGHDVGAELKRHGALPWARTRRILLQAVGALKAAHAKRIIHRDIKPGNCFLIEDETTGVLDVVKLLDFGIAKVGSDSNADVQGMGLTGTGEVFGTASYMSPEQARGEPLDARSDLYSLGIMAYEMLVGEAPFRGVNTIDVIAQHLNGRPEPLRTHDSTISSDVEALVLKMLARARRDRYPSMAALEQALLAIPETAGGGHKARLWSSPGDLDSERTHVVVRATCAATLPAPPAPPAIVLAATSSTGPHVARDDTASETRPYSLDPTQTAARRSVRLVLVVGLVVVLVVGVSALGTMVFLSETWARKTDVLDAGEEQGPALEIATKQEASRIATEPGARIEHLSIVSPQPATAAQPSTNQQTPAPEALEAPVIEEEQAPRPTKTASQPKEPEHETTRCASVREHASTALDQRQWDQVYKQARQKRCWPRGEQSARRSMEVQALLELKRFNDCVAVGAKASDAETMQSVETCREMAR
jgi:serine/threonine protein kinase